MPLDPSLQGSRTGAKAGFDLTWPFGAATKLELRVPDPPNSQQRNDTVEAALEDGPKCLRDLMSEVGSRDGREVVRALEDADGSDRGRARRRRAVFPESELCDLD